MGLKEENKAIQVMGFDNKKRITEHEQPNSGQLGYSMILVEKNPKISKHDKVLKDTEADKEKEKLFKVNKKAYCQLILACEGPIAFNIVRKCAMDDLPTGNIFWHKTN